MLDIPQETLLYIFSFLDIPDLTALSQLSPILVVLAADPILQKQRLLITAPSRVDHSLFGTGPLGDLLRPTVGELVQRGVMKGLGIERKWRMGLYFYTPSSVQLYEKGVSLERRHASYVVSAILRRRVIANTLSALPHNKYTSTSTGAGKESLSPLISRSLLPVIHKLKWCLRRDELAKVVRKNNTRIVNGSGAGYAAGEFGRWMELRGSRVVQDTERVRLALCPGVRKTVRFFEGLTSLPTI